MRLLVAEISFAFHLRLFTFDVSRPTVGISGGGAEGRLAVETEKTPASNLPKNAAHPHYPLHAVLGGTP
jgi:hypothetical protein